MLKIWTLLILLIYFKKKKKVGHLLVIIILLIKILIKLFLIFGFLTKIAELFLNKIQKNNIEIYMSDYVFEKANKNIFNKILPENFSTILESAFI